MALGDIVNFVAVDACIYTAGQPSVAALAEIRAEGFEVVVNLGLLDQDYSLTDEAGSVRALGMSYRHIPVLFVDPKPEDFECFRRTLRELSGRKVFVHCAMNLRVSCFVSLYGELELGWSRERADAHVRRVWEPDPVWSDFLARMRASFGSLSPRSSGD